MLFVAGQSRQAWDIMNSSWESYDIQSCKNCKDKLILSTGHQFSQRTSRMKFCLKCQQFFTLNIFDKIFALQISRASLWFLISQWLSVGRGAPWSRVLYRVNAILMRRNWDSFISKMRSRVIMRLWCYSVCVCLWPVCNAFCKNNNNIHLCFIGSRDFNHFGGVFIFNNTGSLLSSPLNFLLSSILSSLVCSVVPSVVCSLEFYLELSLELSIELFFQLSP